MSTYSSTVSQQLAVGVAKPMSFQGFSVCHIPVIVEQVSTRKTAPGDSQNKFKHGQSSLHFGDKTTPLTSPFPNLQPLLTEQNISSQQKQNQHQKESSKDAEN